MHLNVFPKKEKAKRQREEAIYKEELKILVMDEGRKQFAIEVVEALPLVESRGKQASSEVFQGCLNPDGKAPVVHKYV